MTDLAEELYDSVATGLSANLNLSNARSVNWPPQPSLHMRPPVPRLWRRTRTEPVSARPRLFADDGTIPSEANRSFRML